MTLTRAEAQSLIKSALKAATFKDVTVRVRSSDTANLRFAGTAPTTSGEVEQIDLSVTATRERASATVSGTARDPAGIKELVRRAEALAALAPADPEHMPPLGPQTYLRPIAEDPAVQKVGAEARLEAVARVLKVAREGKLEALSLIHISEPTRPY